MLYLCFRSIFFHFRCFITCLHFAVLFSLKSGSLWTTKKYKCIRKPLLKKTFKLNLYGKLFNCSWIITPWGVWFLFFGFRYIRFSKIMSQLICICVFMAFTNSYSDTKLLKALFTHGFWMWNSSRIENLLSYPFAPCCSWPINHCCFSAVMPAQRLSFLMMSDSKPTTPAAEATGARETVSTIGFISLNLLTRYYSFYLGLRPRSEEVASKAWQHGGGGGMQLFTITHQFWCRPLSLNTIQAPGMHF